MRAGWSYVPVTSPDKGEVAAPDKAGGRRSVVFGEPKPTVLNASSQPPAATLEGVRLVARCRLGTSIRTAIE